MNGGERNSRNARKRAPRSSRLLVENQQLSVLQTISDNTSLNVYGVLPTVPDVKWKKLPRRMVHTFERSATTTTITATAPTSGPYGLEFTLAQLPNYTEFTNMFDQYRIKMVKLTYFPSVANTGSIFHAIDYDDSSTPTLAILEENDTLGINQSNQSWSRVIKPSVDIQVYPGVVGTGYETRQGVWLDSANGSIPHYGLKIFVAAPATGTVSGNLHISYIVQGRRSV